MAEPHRIPGERRAVMTVPEENRPKTRTTDDTVTRPENVPDEPTEEGGRTMEEALDEANVAPEDFEE
jgi:hypothetical protein